MIALLLPRLSRASPNRNLTMRFKTRADASRGACHRRTRAAPCLEGAETRHWRYVLAVNGTPQLRKLGLEQHAAPRPPLPPAAVCARGQAWGAGDASSRAGGFVLACCEGRRSPSSLPPEGYPLRFSHLPHRLVASTDEASRAGRTENLLAIASPAQETSTMFFRFLMMMGA